MPEDSNPQSQEDGRQNPSSPTNSKPISQPNSAPSQENEKRPHWADRTVAVFTVLIFLTYITSDYFLWRQWQITAGQLEEMKGGSAQTDRLIAETHNLAAAAKAQSDSAAAQAGAMKDLAERALTQSKATNSLANETKRSADILQRQSSPWLGIESPAEIEVGPPEFEWKADGAPDISLTVRFSVKNFGNAPAFTSIELADFAPFHADRKLKDNCGGYWRGGETLLPGATKISAARYALGEEFRRNKFFEGAFFTVVIAYNGPGDQNHCSVYQYVTWRTSQTPMPVPGHPEWTYSLFTRARLIGSTAK